MSIFKYIRAAFKFYMLYIQPLLGFYLICSGLWIFNSPVESACISNNLESCTNSATVIMKASIYLTIGIGVVAVWYFTDLQPKLRGEDQEKQVKSGVKPEDFVK